MTYLIVRGPDYSLPIHAQGMRPTGVVEALHMWASGQWPLSVRVPFDRKEEIREDVLAGRAHLEWWTEWPEGWTLDSSTRPDAPMLTGHDLLTIIGQLRGMHHHSDFRVLNGPPRREVL